MKTRRLPQSATPRNIGTQDNQAPRVISGQENWPLKRALQAKPDAPAERLAFYDRIDPLCLSPLWEVLYKILVKEPTSAASAHLWDYAELRPHLLESADVISAAEAERRVLVLENPSMRGHC